MHKDEVLNRLAESANVAQFVAFRPSADRTPVQSYCRIAGYGPNEVFSSTEAAIATLLAASPERAINIRSYEPGNPRSREFIYALTDVQKAGEALTRLTRDGLHTILNETVDVRDGGVSGVVQGNTVEFAPDDTPRCVEKPGVAAMDYDTAMTMLEVVYGFRPDIVRSPDRIEFSIHPRRRGTRNGHTLIWELESDASEPPPPVMNWPNHFSRHIGDKAYGLLVAFLLGYRVPRTLVINRRVAPFSFGSPTGSIERWLRTCPKEPVPGHFTTTYGWADPFQLIAREDPDGVQIASVLSQDAVEPDYSGASVSGPDAIIVEGRSGPGDAYMLGSLPPEALPEQVTKDIEDCYNSLSDKLGPVRFEWVHNKDGVWLVQLHLGATGTSGGIIVPGEPTVWIDFDVSNGLEKLRELVSSLSSDTGLRLVGQVGTTSHIADVVRRAGIPIRLVS
jgi:hypothetical protein